MNCFIDDLAGAVIRHRSPLVVGLDPRWELLPDTLRAKESLDGKAEAYQRFCFEIIDAVADIVPAVKPQMAFFEQLGPAGMAALAEVIRHAQERQLLVILDGKRNDIGSTAEAYACGLLGRESPWGADALTINPYLGDDSLTPFVEVAGKRSAGLFILVKTSNPGGILWQDRLMEQAPLYRHVGDHVERLAQETKGARGYGLVGAVVGATCPEQLAELRAAMPHAWFLVPGFGAQGGSAADVAPAFDERGLGAIVNSSRAVIFAYRHSEYERFGSARWLDAVAQAARDATERILTETPAGEI